MQYLRYTYTKNINYMKLKLKFKGTACILSGSPTIR